MISNETIHRTWIPISHAVLWGVGLLVGVYGSSILGLSDCADNVQVVFSVIIVYAAFVYEACMSYFDLACQNSNTPFTENILKKFGAMLFNVATTIICIILYLKYDSLYVLMVVVLLMSWLKYMTVSVNNNMEKYMYTARIYKSNKLSTNKKH